MILGPRKSGRSNALAIAATELSESGVSQFFVVNPRRSPALQRFAERVPCAQYAERAADVAVLWDAVVQRARSEFASYDAGGSATRTPWAVVVDDADAGEPPPDAADLLQQLVLRGSDVAALILIAADTQSLRASYPSGAMRALLNLRAGILLRPSTADDFDLFGVRGKPVRAPVGRGYFCSGGEKHAVQIFLAEP